MGSLVRWSARLRIRNIYSKFGLEVSLIIGSLCQTCSPSSLSSAWYALSVNAWTHSDGGENMSFAFSFRYLPKFNVVVLVIAEDYIL